MRNRLIPVHFAGLACDMEVILAIARKHDLKVVEDAAHALPTRYKGDLIGFLLVGLSGGRGTAMLHSEF